MKLTTATIDLPAGKKDAVFFDDALRGFGLRIRRGSEDRIMRSWIIQRRMKGRMRRFLIGDAAVIPPGKARERAKKLLAEIALGADPQADKAKRREADEVTLRSVVSDYLDQKTGVKPGTLRMLKSYLQGPLYLKPLHGTPVDRIGRKDVAARVLAVSKASGVPTGIAFRSAVNAMFTWAMQMGLTEINPVIGAFQPERPKSRDRVLIDTKLDLEMKHRWRELVGVWQGVDDDDYGKCIRLMILTGTRRAEIGGMRWSEFNADMTAWTLPESRSKTGQANTLPVTPMMKSILDTIPMRDGIDALFGKKRFTGWSIGKAALDERLDIPAWQHRDIRRSVDTGMNELGVAPHIVERVLNHKLKGVPGIYNRAGYQAEVRAAMVLWSDHVRSIVEGTERKVLAFERSAKELEERYVSTGEGMTFTHSDGTREKIVRGKNGKLVAVKDTGDARGAKGS
jgi:integrase